MAQRTITGYAGTVVSDDAVGTVPWANPEDAEGAPDGVSATAVGAGKSEYLLADTYDLSLPGTAKPRSALFRVHRRCDSPLLARAYLLGLEPSALWGLGESSGNALDLVGSNHGSVTLGTGQRAVSALDDQGDGALKFDGSTTHVQVAPGTAINDLWDGGGAFFALFNTSSNGYIASKGNSSSSGWVLQLLNLGSGQLDIRFGHAFSSNRGRWRTPSRVVEAGKDYAICVLYNSSNTSSDPTIYLYDIVVQALSVLTVGNGLTEDQSPSGLRASDASDNLNLGVLSSSGYLNGTLDEIALVNGSQPSTDEIGDYNALVAEVGSEVAESPVTDDAVRLIVDGAAAPGDLSSPKAWATSDIRADIYGPVDISGRTPADVATLGLALSADVPVSVRALIDAIEIEETHDIFADVTVTAPAASPDREIDWPSYTFGVSVEVDGQPVTLASSRWRIYADAAGTQLVGDSGVRTGDVTTYTFSASPARAWEGARDGQTYYLLVDVIEDGGFDGQPIDGSSGLVPIVLNTSMPKVTAFAAEAVTVEEEGS